MILPGRSAIDNDSPPNTAYDFHRTVLSEGTTTPKLGENRKRLFFPSLSCSNLFQSQYQVVVPLRPFLPMETDSSFHFLNLVMWSVCDPRMPETSPGAISQFLRDGGDGVGPCVSIPFATLCPKS
jgi:hypothetical protein